MIKICILGQNFSVHLQKWIKAIYENGNFEVHVVTYDKGTKFSGITYHYISQYTNTKLDYVLNAFKVRQILFRIKPDIIHAHYATSYGFMANFTGIHPFVLTGWGADIFDSPKNPIMKLLLKNIFKNADEISVLSKVTQREMKKLSPKEIHLIPFGVDIQKFTPKHKTESKAKFHIGTVRSFEEKYGLEYLIRAFASLSLKYTHIHLDLVGDGPQKEYLKSLATELDVIDKITFHGYIHQNIDFEKYISIFNNFDVFTILSIIDSETFGVAAVEASSCGIPVIATNVGGLPEVIENEITGLIVPPKDAIQTAIALERLILDPALCKRLGENGRKKVENEYNWERSVEKMIAIYTRLADKV